MQFQVSLLYEKFSSVLFISNEEEQSEVTRAAEEIEFDDCSKGLGSNLIQRSIHKHCINKLQDIRTVIKHIQQYNIKIR
jgi:hypothetical protein